MSKRFFIAMSNTIISLTKERVFMMKRQQRDRQDRAHKRLLSEYI